MPVTRQQVVDAYRWFLGREPENEDAIAAQLHIASFDALRHVFRASREFSDICGPQVENHFPPLDLAPCHVDVDADPEQLQKLLNRIKAEWENFGRTDPHWSVVTEAEFAKAKFEQNREWFFATGASGAIVVDRFLERHRIRKQELRTCFELGCGVGRTTIHLAKMFPQVVAADISAPHLELCREEVKRGGHQNVALVLLKEIADIGTLPRFDVFASFIVLQHNPPPVQKELLLRILRHLNPGGVAVFQVKTYDAKYRFDLRDFLAHPPSPHMEMHVIPQPAVFDAVAAAGCRVVEVREDSLSGGRKRDALSNTFFVRKP